MAHQQNRYHRPSGVDDWILLDGGQWAVTSHGRLDILGDGYVQRFSRSRSLDANELRITYSSGFDLTADSKEVKELKAIAGNILGYINAPQFSGVTRNRVDREMEQEYSMAGAKVGEIPAMLLVGLKKYAPTP